MKSANILEYHQQLAKATIPGDLTYESMKMQLSRIFGDTADISADSSDTLFHIKTQVVNEASEYDAEQQF